MTELVVRSSGYQNGIAWWYSKTDNGQKILWETSNEGDDVSGRPIGTYLFIEIRSQEGRWQFRIYSSFSGWSIDHFCCSYGKKYSSLGGCIKAAEKYIDTI